MMHCGRRAFRLILLLLPLLRRSCTASILSDNQRCEENGQCASGCCRFSLLRFLFQGGPTCDSSGFGFLSWCVRGYDLISDNNFALDGKTEQSTSNTFKVMAYNIYLINGAPDFPRTMIERVNKIGAFFRTRDEEVVVMEEVWWHRSRVQEAMLNAGYIHYAYDDRNQGRGGSGLALYSRLPIEEHDFLPYMTSSKGIIYAKVRKDQVTSIHLFGTHNDGDDDIVGDKHDTRRQEYALMRSFMDGKVQSDDELVLMLGDFNEEKNLTPENYATMLLDLDAGEFIHSGATEFSWNDPESTFQREEWPAMTLDFVFYDQSSSLIPGEGSQCEYLKPYDEEGKSLSDHLPIACTIELP